MLTGLEACETLTSGIKESFLNGGIEVTEYIPVGMEHTEDEIRQFLERVRKRGRSKYKSNAPKAV